MNCFPQRRLYLMFAIFFLFSFLAGGCEKKEDMEIEDGYNNVVITRGEHVFTTVKTGVIDESYRVYGTKKISAKDKKRFGFPVIITHILIMTQMEINEALYSRNYGENNAVSQGKMLQVVTSDDDLIKKIDNLDASILGDDRLCVNFKGTTVKLKTYARNREDLTDKIEFPKMDKLKHNPNEFLLLTDLETVICQ